MLQMWEEGIHWLDEWSQGWLSLLARAGRASVSYQSSLLAAAIAYFALFSLFPLTLLTVAIASMWFDPMLAESEIVLRLEFVVPALGQLLGENLERIIRLRGSVTLLSLLSLLWSSSTIFHHFSRASDAIWGVGGSRPVWRHRGLAILMALSLSIILFLISLAWSAGVAFINQLLPAELIDIYGYVVQFTATLSNMLLFGLLYYFLPHKRLNLVDVFPGAITGGLLWEVAKRFFLYFVTEYLSLSNLLYGSVAAIIAFLTWAYLSTLIFLFGAYLNVFYYRSLQAREARTGGG